MEWLTVGSKVRIELDHDGIRELLQSAAIGGEVQKAAQRIASEAGEGFEVTTAQSLSFGGGRVGYGVKAATYEARKTEAEDKVLSKAVSACRL
jgi:hypothetical protein